MPPATLQPFVTTFYRTEIQAPDIPGWIEDYLHPEWPNIRIVPAGLSMHAIGDGELEPTPVLAATGPTTKPTRFRMGSGRSWGIGLLPLGWAKLVDGQAKDYANRAVDGAVDAAFSAFQGLPDKLLAAEREFAEDAALITDHLEARLSREIRDEEVIVAVNAALVDREVGTVMELAERAGLTVRSLERLCLRAFGFSPKLLLRRQRFLRSLAQFMLDPSLKWLSAMDYHYHDQAHFVRDFRKFMSMSPNAYRKLDHPLLGGAAQARAEIMGEPMQVLHQPPAP